MAKNLWLTTVESDQLKNEFNNFNILSHRIRMVRSREDNGTPYGPVLIEKAEIVVKLEYNYGAKVLYERLNENADNYFALRENDRIIAEMLAYVTDIEEYYSPSTNGKGSTQLLARITLLVTEITYRGNESSINVQFG